MIARFDAGDPIFRGHFEGRPILPGFVELALVEQALGAPLAEVRSLRLRHLVGPGAGLDVALAAEGDAIRFALRADGRSVAGGTVTTAAAGVAGRSGGHPLPPGLSGTPSAADLLPHAPPALFTDRAVALDDAGLSAVAHLPARHALVRDGAGPALAALEMAAQAAALFEALVRIRGGGPAAARVGYLVGARDLRFAVARIPVETCLLVEIRLSGAAPPLSTYAAAVTLGATRVMTGTISTYLV